MWRICDNKANGKYNLNWEQVGKILNHELNEDFTSSKWRKNYQVMKKGYERAIKKNSDSSAILEKYEKAKFELETEKVKVRDQRREHRKIIREVARAEYLKEYIEDSARKIAIQKPLEWNKNEFKLLGSNEAIAMISDYHMGMEVENFLNVYNKEVFKARIQKHIAKIIEYGQMNKVSKLHVLDLGDNISGIIHTTTRIANNEDIISQIQYVSEVFAEGFIQLSEYFPQVEFYSVLDNHSRVSPNIKESIDKESFSRIIPWYLKTRMSHVENFNVNDNELDLGLAVFDVCGFKCYGVHGHKDHPKTVVSNLSLMTKVIPDFIFMGHYHKSVEDNVNGVFVIGNPSGIGTDEYAKNQRLSGQAQQKMVIINEHEGRFATYNISL